MAVTEKVVDVPETVAAVEKKLQCLELSAQKRLRGGQLPPLPEVRRFANSRALYNAVDSALVRLDKVADALPKDTAIGRSHIQAELIDYDPGERFFEQMAPATTQLITSAQEIGSLTGEFGEAAAVVAQQIRLLGDCIRAEAAVISKAAKMAKPHDPDVLRAACKELVDASVDVAELKYDISDRSELYKHSLALADTAAALGWVLAPASVKHVRDYRTIITGSTESILARYIELGCNPIHSDFAEALNTLLETLAKYVAKEHPAGLRWNYAAGATPLGYRRAERTVAADAHPFGDFFKILHGSVTQYYCCSKELGGVLAKQAECVLSCFVELGNVIETASSKTKPAGSGEAELRMLLMPLSHELTALQAIAIPEGPECRYQKHVEVVKESMSCMQWCTAGLSKMSPVSFIIDIKGVADVYIEKLLAEHAGDYREGEPYRTAVLREWCRSIQQFLLDLRDYVKTHHPNGLMFDTHRSRRSMDELNKKSELKVRLAELRQVSTTRKWTLSVEKWNQNGRTRERRVWSPRK